MAASRLGGLTHTRTHSVPRNLTITCQVLLSTLNPKPPDGHKAAWSESSWVPCLAFVPLPERDTASEKVLSELRGTEDALVEGSNDCQNYSLVPSDYYNQSII